MILVRKLLYTFGALVALIAILVAGAITVAGAMQGAWLTAALAGLGVCAGVAFVWFAHRRTNALDAERRERERSESDAALDAALAERIMSSRFVARRTLLAIVGAPVLTIAFAAGAVWTWSTGDYVLAAVLGFVGGMLVWLLAPMLSNRDAVIVDARGVELPGRYELIPWKAIHEAVFWSYKHRSRRIAQVRLGVRNAARYRHSRWALHLDTGHDDEVEIPLNGLDGTPESVFAAIRHFHERAVPAGTLLGEAGYYRVDPQAARLEVIHKRMLEIGEEMKRMAADLERKGRVAGDSPEMKAFERASELRLKEMEALSAESSKLLSAQTRRFEERVGRAARSLTRLGWLAYGALALVFLFALIGSLAR
ncbi:MAG: hypothetical protein ACREMQ_21000 [Longimicrobiales bacterium]